MIAHVAEDILPGHPDRLADAVAGLDDVLPGIGATWDAARVRLNGAGDFSCGGPHGDNGLSGKKLVVDHYGPGVPIGGGALCGKDPHKVDRAGALAARQLAVQLVRDGGLRAATVYLVFVPGRREPESCIAYVDGLWWDDRRIAAAIDVPDLSIEGIVRRFELATVRWVDVLRHGYFGSGHAWDDEPPVVS
jgi:S-adenosylmethionine synthetase